MMKEYGHLIVDKEIFTHIESKVRGNKVVLGQLQDSTLENPKYDKSKIAFSPNNDGYADEAQFVGTFLRNYEGLTLSIVNEQGEVYKLVDNEPGIKNFYKGNPVDTNTITRQNGKVWAWDGKISENNYVKDGDYTMKIHVNADAKLGSQDIEIPIKVDTVYPRIGKSEFNKDKMEFTISSIIEEGSGVRSVKLVDRNNNLEKEIPFNLNDGVYSVQVPKVNLDNVYIEIEDHAYNKESLPIHKAERTGDEYVLYVNGVVGKSEGILDSKSFKWHLVDESLTTVDQYNLRPGKYTIVVDSYDEEAYVLDGQKRISVTIEEGQHSTVQNVKFNYKDRETIDIQVSNNYQANIEVVLLNKLTGEEYPFKALNNILRATVPHGNYKLLVKNIEEGYVAEVTGKKDFEVGRKLSIFQDTIITVSKAKTMPIDVQVKRNGYAGKLVVEFVSNVKSGKNVEVEFLPEENSKQVELIARTSYQVYVNNIDGYGYANEEDFIPSKIDDSIEIVLNQGQNNKLKKVNFEFLEYKISAAENLNKVNYKAGWEDLQKVLEESKEMINQKIATQEEVNNQIAKLQQAIDNLVSRIADKTQLEEKIREAEEFKGSLREGEFTPEAMDFLNVVIQAAKMRLMSNKAEEITPEAIEDQINKLDQAMNNIRQNSSNLKEELQNVIDEAKKYLDNRSDLKENEALIKLEKILPKAEKLLLIEAKTQEDKIKIKGTINSLKDAISGLEFITDKTVLINLIREFESIDLNEYEEQSSKEFADALNEAKKVSESPSATTKDVREAINRLGIAKSNLKKNVNLPDVDEEYQNVPVEACHIETGKPSSADGSLNHIAKVKKVSDNLYEYVIQFKEEGAVIQNLKFSDENNVKHDVNPEKIEGEYNKQYRFTLPKKDKVRIGFNMYVELVNKNMDVETDLLFDWSNFKEPVEPIKRIQPISEEVNKDEKIYNVNPRLMKFGENVESQANNMINHQAQVVLKDGMYKYAISFGKMNSILEKVRVKIGEEWIDLSFEDNKFIFSSKDKLEGQRTPIKFVYEAPGIGRHEKEADLIFENWVLSANKENDNPIKPNPNPAPTPIPTPQPIPVPENGRDNINRDKPIIYIQPGGVEYNSPYYGRPSITAGNLQANNNKIENNSKNEINKTKKDDNSNFNKIEDVSGHWAESVIKYVMEKGYFKGTTQSTFSPEQEITGAQFVTVLGRKSNISDSTDNNQYFKAHVDWAEKLGILEGLEDGFNPNADLSREEMAVILNNYLISTGVIENSKEKIKYTDKDEISYWTEDAIANLSANGILKGMENGKFSPKTSFTRAQIAQVLYNLDIK